MPSIVEPTSVVSIAATVNALRYSADGTVRLSVTTDPERIGITVANRVDGRRAAGSGLGLLGMAERVALLGGSLTHGIREPGRFQLEATLPVAP